jgi:hypothetical protein
MRRSGLSGSREGGREGAGVGSDTGPTTITFFLVVGFLPPNLLRLLVSIEIQLISISGAI